MTYPKFLDPPPFPSLFSHLTAVSTRLSQIFDRIIRQTLSNHFQPFETRPRTRCNTAFSLDPLSRHDSPNTESYNIAFARVLRPAAATKSRSTEYWREEKKVYLGRCKSWIEKLIGRKIWKGVRVERTFTYERARTFLENNICSSCRIIRYLALLPYNFIFRIVRPLANECYRLFKVRII